MDTPVGGTASLLIDNEPVTLKGKLMAALYDREKEEIVGMDGSVNFTEKPVAPMIKATLLFTKDTNIDKIQRALDVDVQIDLNNGSQGVLRGAVVKNRIEHDAESGEFEVEWFGEEGEWIKQ